MQNNIWKTWHADAGQVHQSQVSAQGQGVTMSCDYCDLDAAVERNRGDGHGSYLVGEWAFTKDDDLAHHAEGRINLWYDFEDGEWSLLIMVADDRVKDEIWTYPLPSCVMFHPNVCPMCGRRLT